MTLKKHWLLKISICLILIFSILPVFGIGKVFAEEDGLTINSLISNHGKDTENSQEITDSLGFNTDFGDKAGAGSTEDWKIPSFSGTAVSQVYAGDFTSEAGFDYGENSILYNTIGTDGIEGNKFALLFLLNESGIAGIESPDITIPAHALYVLTFNVKVAKLGNSGTNPGINAKLIATDGTIVSMDAIKTVTENYVTYAFLIQGNEFEEKTVKLQILFGNAVEENGVTTKAEQIGYAAVDTVRMFSVSYSQFSELTEDKAGKQVSLLTQNSNYVFINNGYFNVTENQNWKLSENKSLSDLRPLNWKQEGAAEITNYGIINTNQAIFNSRLTELGLTVVNPGNPDRSSTENSHNNVLMLHNSQASKQTIKSTSFALAKNGYFEISFKFFTPKTEENNALSFYIVDSTGKTIYAKENMFSYVESGENGWATFHAFVKTIDTEKTVNFIIKFGNDAQSSEGFAFVDDVRLIKKQSSAAVFTNNEENKYILKAEEGEEEIKYLPTGTVTFEDLLKLDETKEVNQPLLAFTYEKPTSGGTDGEEDDDKGTQPTNTASIAWYVVPSVLFGACLIAGIVLYYVRKIKIKKPAKKTDNKYDRKKTLEKQIKQREQSEKTMKKADFENQLKQVQDEILKLEQSYEKNQKDKQSPLALQTYLSKRQKLQNKQIKIQDQINKLNK